MCKKNYKWNPATCSCKNGIYVTSNIDDSVITCDEVIEERKTIAIKRTSTKTIPTKSTSAKNRSNKMYFNTNLFVNYQSIIDSC